MLSSIAILLAYLFGSLSSAIIVCKFMRLPDPRTQGSHNPGATNVLRIGGSKAAAITLIGDMLKGYIPVLIASTMEFSNLTIAGVMFAAFMGHLFPIYFRFQGGKGVATFMGCLLALNWPSGAAYLCSWVLIATFLRYSSLASLLSSLFAPIFVWQFTGNSTYYTVSLLISLILIYRHKENIEKLLTGKESKISLGSK